MTELLNMEQGSDEWLEARLNHFCASEAAVVMGDSKFMTRDALLDLKKGWQSNPNSSFKERLFQRGHETEDLARSIVEANTFDFYPPKVAKRVVEGMMWLASFDGLQAGEIGGEIYEHKMFNEILAENVRNGLLEPHHYWQLEHQCEVNKSDKVRFVCSDGTRDQYVEMIYTSIPKRAKALRAGWKQFGVDLENHELTAKVEKVEAKVIQLPSVFAEVENGVITTNIAKALPDIKSLASKEIGKELKNDQDFADKENLIKKVTILEDNLKSISERLTSKFTDLATVQADIAESISLLRDVRLDGDKSVKAEKKRLKEKIKEDAQIELAIHLTKVNERVAPRDISIITVVRANWDEAMKNKRTIASLKSSVNEELARVKVLINETADIIEPNMKYLRENASEYKQLFRDIDVIINQPAESFNAVVNARINEAKEAEKVRLEEVRIQTEKDTEARLKREAQDKIDQDARDEQERIDQENRNKESLNKASVDALNTGTGIIKTSFDASNNVSVDHIPADEFSGIDMASGPDKTVYHDLPMNNDMEDESSPVHYGAIETAKQKFDDWWEFHGGGMHYYPGEDQDDFTCRVAKEAYKACLAHNNLSPL